MAVVSFFFVLLSRCNARKRFSSVANVFGTDSLGYPQMARWVLEDRRHVWWLAWPFVVSDCYPRKAFTQKNRTVVFFSLCPKTGIFKYARNYLCGCFETVLQANKIRPHKKIGVSLSLGVTASNSFISVCCLLHRNRRTRDRCTLSSRQPEIGFYDYHCQNGQGLSQLYVISNGTSATEQQWRI